MEAPEVVAPLRELAARDEGSWRIGEMKSALKLHGVAVEAIAEKAELLSLTRELIAATPAATATPATAATPDSAPPAEADAHSGPQAGDEKAGGRSGGGGSSGGGSAGAAAKMAALDDSDDDGEDAIAAGAERAKSKGNECFGRGEFAAAAKHFSTAIKLTPKNHVLYSNRSGAYAAIGKGADALSDANECLKLAPRWPKGHSRKGAALVLTGDYKGAMRACGCYGSRSHALLIGEGGLAVIRSLWHTAPIVITATSLPELARGGGTGRNPLPLAHCAYRNNGHKSPRARTTVRLLHCAGTRQDSRSSRRMLGCSRDWRT